MKRIILITLILITASLFIQKNFCVTENRTDEKGIESIKGKTDNKKSVVFPINNECNIKISVDTPTVLFDSWNSEIPYRIPSIVTAKDGTLIAIADYRIGGNDIGNAAAIHIVSRISYDYGKTWEPEEIIIPGNNVTDTTAYEVAHGDATTICDDRTGNLLLMCASGSLGFPRGGCQVGRYYSNDNGNTWIGEEMTNDNGLPKELASGKFFTSGRMVQDKQSGRIYAGICAKGGSYVVYSDDFGQNWHILGNEYAYVGGDECAVTVLPNRDILVSARVAGQTGRGFNIFHYEKNGTTGSWQKQMKSNIVAACCNGELLLYPFSNNSRYSLLLLSVPMSEQREKVGIYYKIIDNKNSAYLESSFYQDFDGCLIISDTTSAYSTMTQMSDGRIGFLYEETVNAGNGTKFSGWGYNIVFCPISIKLKQK